jgi:hypothetical protein
MGDSLKNYKDLQSSDMLLFYFHKRSHAINYPKYEIYLNRLQIQD